MERGSFTDSEVDDNVSQRMDGQDAFARASVQTKKSQKAREKVGAGTARVSQLESTEGDDEEPRRWQRATVLPRRN